MLLDGISTIFGESTAQKHAAFCLSCCKLERTAYAGLQISEIPAIFEDYSSNAGIIVQIVVKLGFFKNLI